MSVVTNAKVNYLSGGDLSGADYTATNGTSVVLAVGRATNDIVEMVAFTTGSTISTTGALVWQSVKTANFTAVSGNAYPVNTTSGVVTVTLPSSPAAGAYVTIVDYAGTASTNNVIVAGNGSNIQGTIASVLITANRQAYNFVYIDSTQGWISYAQDYSTPQIQTFSISYLVVAGGGGGGSSAAAGGGTGGGGAGGLVTGTANLSQGIVYTATVGAGGAGGIAGAAPASNATNSSLTGGSLSITTAVGGGYGGYDTSGSTSVAGGNGGSGGGGAGNTTITAGTGTSGQGNNGGNGINAGSYFGGGGGGGAGGVGGTGTSTTGGVGGAGSSSSITGSAVIYAAGGGGGVYNLGTGGAGGSSGVGGAGGRTTGNGGNGTPSTGSGGGGGGNTSTVAANGGNGAGGIVILSVPTAIYSGITTGSPTVTTSGSNKILTFTSSGTYTA